MYVIPRQKPPPSRMVLLFPRCHPSFSIPHLTVSSSAASSNAPVCCRAPVHLQGPGVYVGTVSQKTQPLRFHRSSFNNGSMYIYSRVS